MKEEHIVPGEQAFSVIAAEVGSTGERIIRHLAKSEGTDTYPTATGPWSEQKGVRQAEMEVRMPNGQTRKATLQIGGIGQLNGQALVIKDDNMVRKLMRPTGSEVRVNPRNLAQTERRIGHVGEQIVAAAIVHGHNWMDRMGAVVETPFGSPSNGERTKIFVLSHKTPVERENFRDIPGLFFAPHVGEWGSRTRLLPAAAGIPALLHEYRGNGADPNSHVGSFAGTEISGDRDVWGPYMSWAQHPADGDFAELAQRASSPFSFHVAATKRLFPEATLSSTAFLEHFGADGFRELLETLLEVSPTRFYRLVDHNGRRHRQTSNNSRVLVFGDEVFPRTSVVQNVMASFEELSKMEHDPSVGFDKRPRVVLDDSTYIVLSAIVMRQGDEAHCLSGSKMVEYLFGDTQVAETHRVACDKVYRVARRVFTDLPARLCLQVHPSEALKMDGSQYDAEARAKAQQILG